MFKSRHLCRIAHCHCIVRTRSSHLHLCHAALPTHDVLAMHNDTPDLLCLLALPSCNSTPGLHLLVLPSHNVHDTCTRSSHLHLCHMALPTHDVLATCNNTLHLLRLPALPSCDSTPGFCLLALPSCDVHDMCTCSSHLHLRHAALPMHDILATCNNTPGLLCLLALPSHDSMPGLHLLALPSHNSMPGLYLLVLPSHNVHDTCDKTLDHLPALPT